MKNIRCLSCKKEIILIVILISFWQQIVLHFLGDRKRVSFLYYILNEEGVILTEYRPRFVKKARSLGFATKGK